MLSTISNLFGAFGRLTAALNALATTTEEANQGLRQRLGFEEPLPALPAPEEGSKKGRAAR